VRQVDVPKPDAKYDWTFRTKHELGVELVLWFLSTIRELGLQVKVWSSLGCWQLNQWLFTLVELSCWDEEPSVLSDRSDRPWDDVSRRPSHKDRRSGIAQEMLEHEFLSSLTAPPDTQKFRTVICLCL
jgi:hypothetical protein